MGVQYIDDRLIEILTPLSNEATISPTEYALATLGLNEPFSLEIAFSDRGCRFLARAGSEEARRRLKSQLASAYPQADLTMQRIEEGDPAYLRPDEKVMTALLDLRTGEHLPIRTFRDADVEDERNSQADPILNILNSVSATPAGFRAHSQLVLKPAPAGWAGGYRRLAEPPDRSRNTSGIAGIAATAMCFVLLGLGAQGWVLYQERRLLYLAGLIVGGLFCLLALAAAAMRLGRNAPDPHELVREKIGLPGYWTQLRLSVYAPLDADEAEMYDVLTRFVGGYRPYELETGNGFVHRFLPTCDHELRTVEFVGKGRRAVLNVRELGGLWHLPQALADVPRLRRTGSKKIVPLACLVASGTYIGESVHQDESVPVHLPVRTPAPHMVAVAKTRQGKSTWMQRMALEVMQDPRRSLFLVDPHTDLAHAVAGVVPLERHEETLYLSFGDRRRPIGFNLLDAGMGWERDKLVSDILAVFQSESGDSWGSRIEPVFGWALTALYEANARMLAEGRVRYDDETGDVLHDPRREQYTLLDVPRMYNDQGFCETVLESVWDRDAREWWKKEYWSLAPRDREEYTASVKFKISRLARSHTAKAIIGQPVTTIEPREWLKNRAVVIVDTAEGVIGENLARLLGAVLINLMSLLLQEQATEGERQRVTFIVDEFQKIPGAAYETILSELAKYGANMILATQSLATLRTIDTPNKRRYISERLFSNVDCLLVFRCSATDAQELLPELGGGLTVDDVAGLDRHECYVRVADERRKHPVYSCRLAPPPATNGVHAQALAFQAASKYGSDLEYVENCLASSYARAEEYSAEFKRTKTLGKQPTPAGVAPARETARGADALRAEYVGAKGKRRGRKPEAVGPASTPYLEARSSGREDEDGSSRFRAPLRGVDARSSGAYEDADESKGHYQGLEQGRRELDEGDSSGRRRPPDPRQDVRSTGLDEELDNFGPDSF